MLLVRVSLDIFDWLLRGAGRLAIYRVVLLLLGHCPVALLLVPAGGRDASDVS